MQDPMPLVLMAGAIISVLFLPAGCASSPTPRANVALSANEIVESLQESYPKGATPDVARQRMEQNGFECSWVTSGTFVDQEIHDDGSTTKRTVENIDFIRCRRQTRVGMAVTYIDSVALVVENGVVVDALSRWSAVGP